MVVLSWLCRYVLRRLIIILAHQIIIIDCRDGAAAAQWFRSARGLVATGHHKKIRHGLIRPWRSQWSAAVST